MWSRKREKAIAGKILRDERPAAYRQLVWRQFRRNRLASWSLRILYGLVFVAVFADFIANERPLFCRLEGRTYFPVLRQYAVDLGLASWEARFVQNRWRDQPFERVVWAPIPYSAHTIDRGNLQYRHPWGQQKLESWRWRHWLGTDQTGRDVAAGMIRGTRVALSVGLIAMGIATLIGLFFGSLAGFFGDRDLRLSRAHLLLNGLGGLIGLYYAFGVRGFALREGPFGRQLLISLALLAGTLVISNLLAAALRRIPWLGQAATVPVDLLVMRLIEIINAIPTLLLLLAVVAVVRQPSIWYVMIIIGLISWTGIARFVRAELLRIRRQEFIEAARALGLGPWRILFRHALPNALTPVLIAVAFGIAGAILLEAFLSFLGIGMPPDSVTWGTLLNLARSAPKAWWLAVFPGLAIFLTVTLFNLIGEGLTEAIDPREKKR